MLALAPLLAVALSLDTARAVPNDNTVAAGRLRHGVLTAAIDVRPAMLYPEGGDGPGELVYAFAEAGRAPTTPGPLLRVPAGTELHITVSNPLAVPLYMHGLNDHPAAADSVAVAPGASREFVFRATTPGTYIYGGSTGAGFAQDCQLVGALVVDPPGGARPDRVLVITLWSVDADTARHIKEQETFMVNGRAWPYTERLAYTVGDSVRWRVINATVAPHPMHLHGFYYRILARGTMSADTAYAEAQQRLAVTEFLMPFTTMSMTWSPDRPGNWLFHCHLIAHIGADLRLRDSTSDAHAAQRDESMATMHHALDEMAGLVVGIHVRPRRGAVAAADPAPQRRVRVFVDQKDSVFGAAPGYALILQNGVTAPARDSVRFPGSMVTLTRGEPTEILVTNRSHEPVTIHWHGMELESRYDGVGGWSGDGPRVVEPIAPGDSFVVRMTPDRAGTFIYHTHMDEGGQLSSGLYGPLIILEPGQQFDSASERILLLGTGGPRLGARPLVNGDSTPAPMDLVAGHTYRLRLINIAASSVKRVRLLADTTVQQWRGYAKDGAYLPDVQRTVRPARVLMGPGETYDYEFTPQPRDYTLEITTWTHGVPQPNVLRVAVRGQAMGTR